MPILVREDGDGCAEGLVEFHLNHYVSQALRKYAVSKLGLRVVSDPHVGIDEHVTLVLEREVARYVICGIVVGRVLYWDKTDSRLIHAGNIRDIGGPGREFGKYLSSWRHKLGHLPRIFYHGCTPIVSAADAGRPAGECTNKILDCLDKCGGEPLCWVASHSLYYIPKHDVALVTLRTHYRIGWASFHVFPEGAQGDYIGCYDTVEAHWERVDHVITMTARGNGNAYVHSDMAWLRDTIYKFKVDGVEHTLAWTCLSNYGSNSIYVFSIIDGAAANRAPQHLPTELEGHIADAAGATLAKVRSMDVDEKTLPFLNAAATHALTTLVPKASLGDATEAAVDLALTRFGDTTRLQHIASLSGVIRGVGALRTQAMAGYSYTSRLAAEVQRGVDTLFRWHGVLWLAMVVLALLVPWVVWCLVGSYVLTCLALATYAYFADASLAYPLPRPLLAYWLPIPMWQGLPIELLIGLLPGGCIINFVMECLFGSVLVAPLHLLFLGAFGWLRHLSYDVAIEVISIYDVCCGQRQLQPMRVGSKLHVGEGDCTPHVRLLCLAFYTPWCYPVVARRCIHNELVGLRNRVLLEVPAVDPAFWASAYTLVLPLLACARYCTITWDEWLVRFPLPKRRKFAPYYDATFKRTSYFVTVMIKLEKMLKAHSLPTHQLVVHPDIESDVDMFDPRIISMRTPEYQSRFGPYCLAISDTLKDCWNMSYHVCYACGMTLPQLGAWLDTTLELFDEPVFYTTDFHRFDAHISVAALRLQYAVMALVSGVKTDLTGDYNTVGLFPATGTRYCVTGTRKSGNADTSVGNSIINVAFWATVLHKLVVPWENARLIVMGDDAVLALNHCHVSCDDIANAAKGSGLVIKSQCLTSALLLRFCSCYFYVTPTGRHRAAQCLGRYLAKAGFALNAPMSHSYHIRWLRCFTHCLVAEFAHVPVMRALCLLMSRIVFEYNGDYAHLYEILHIKVNLAEFQMGLGGGHSATSVPLGTYHALPFSQLALMYDVTVHDLLDCEAWLLRLPHTLPLRLDHWVLRRFVDTDV